VRGSSAESIAATRVRHAGLAIGGKTEVIGGATTRCCRMAVFGPARDASQHLPIPERLQLSPVGRRRPGVKHRCVMQRTAQDWIVFTSSPRTTRQPWAS